MKLNPAEFNTWLRAVGQRVKWREASVCPCRNEFSGAAEATCPLCHGKGWLWAAAVDGVIGIPRQDVNRFVKEFGTYEAGDMAIAVGSDSPLYGMGRFDRVVLMNSTDRFERFLVRGENDVVDAPVAQITRCYWRNPTGTALEEGAIPAWDPVTKALTWEDGEGPPIGQQYAIIGTKYDEYFIFDRMPSDRNEHQGLQLPKRVPLRKFDLFGR